MLPYQGSGFANLATEATVREVCEEAGIVWERPRNLIFERFPAVIKHYLLCPVKPAPPRPPALPPPPGTSSRCSLPRRVRSPRRPSHPVWRQVGELFRYTADGWRGVGV